MSKRKNSTLMRELLKFNVSEQRRKLKIKAIQYKGGKCVMCGYDRYPSCLSFHHKDPTQKDFAISSGSRNFNKIKKELDKCILLCVRCHSELHAELDKIKEKELLRKILSLKESWPSSHKTYGSVKTICKNCNKQIKVFLSAISSSNFCSVNCKNEFGWPSTQELLKLKESLSTKEIAVVLNKNIKTVRNKFSKIKKIINSE